MVSEGTFAHRPEVDGLRAVAVLPVIWHHAGLPGLPGGFLGVDVFFVISGYLITGILLSDLSADRFSLGRFYERRARRILPALIAMLLLSLPFAVWLLLPGQLVDFGESVLSVTVFLSNVHFWQSTNYFAEAASLQPLLHTWSLAVEEQFYLLYPLVLWLVWRFARSALVPALVVMATASFAVSVWASHAMPVANFYLLPTRAWELLAGALCVFAARKAGGGGIIASLTATVGLAAMIAAMIILDETWALPGTATLLVVLGTACVIVFARPGQGLAWRVLTFQPIVGVGLISYSAYLFHQPLMAFARIGWPEAAGPVLLGCLGLLTLILAALSWRFVEQPFRRKSGTLLPRRGRVFTAAAVASVVMAALGIGLIATQGLASRYAPEDRELALFDRQSTGDYVRGRFNAAQLRPFDETGRPRLLIVGDSFGQDFMNVLAESGHADAFSISTHHVSKHCGNLLVAEDLSRFVSPVHTALCEAEGGWQRASLQPLIEQADVIVLVSDWQPWHWDFLPETVSTLTTRTGADVYVLGRKDFGHVHLHSLLDQPAAARPALRNPATERQAQADMALASALGDRFIDVQGALCPDPAGCPLFTPEGALISYDGGHLTREGATWAGPRLAAILPFVEEAAR